jgi:DMSO/TMAO reductase YedYZ molybdopterin-dependent catalytic subunit
MSAEPFRFEELQLAKRNHGLPLEALRYPLTPVGMHYVLTHFDVPAIDGAAWRLELGGLVERPRSLSLAELRARPAVEEVVTLECAGNGRARLSPRPFSQPWLDEAVGTARWRGAALAPLLEEAGIRDSAVELVFAGVDRGIEGGSEHAFERSLGVREALESGAVLAYEMNGHPLPPQHGFPVRLVVPGWYGMASVKWLVSIVAVAEPFRGFYQARAYTIRAGDEEPGLPVTRMQPRAVMVPPGIPSWPERHRTLDPGPCTLEGRAWSGLGAVASVQVSADGGATWHAAALEPDVPSRWAWRGWRWTWEPPGPGEYELACRARDEAGNEQPLEPVWNSGGYVNNSVQRVAVTVRG